MSLIALLTAISEQASAGPDPEPAFDGKTVAVDFSTDPRTENGLTFLEKSVETKWAPAEVGGARAIRGTGYAYFSFASPEFKNGGLPLVRVTFEYLDPTPGTLSFEFDSSDSSVHPGPQAGVWKGRRVTTSRATGPWRTGTVIVRDGRFSNRCNGGDFRLVFGGSAGDSWTLRRVTVTAASPEDQEKNRQEISRRAYISAADSGPFPLTRAQVLEQLGPYTGQSLLTAPVQSLRGKVVCGYQGWFAAPGDGSHMGWVHYSEHGGFEPGDCHIEYWPDTSELDPDEKFPTPFHKADGSTAYVPSSYNRKTVLRHFRWMKTYGIDGAFVQRFVNSLRSPADLNKVNTVLTHVREAANLTGRTYSVMYDLSGGGDCADLIINDWKSLVDRMRLAHDPADKAYQEDNGKPVVTLWGLFAERANQHQAIQRVIEFLHNDPQYGGCAVMLGVANDWQTNMTPEGRKMLQLCEAADIISPWMVGRFGDPAGARRFIAEHNVPDQKWCAEHGKEYMPVIFPGFSWTNMHDGQTPANQIPRLQGRFFWTQAMASRNAGASMLYIAMFDEIDEGTAIFKCDPNPPVGETHFLSFEGLPSDYYLWLAGQIGRLFRGEIPESSEPPQRPASATTNHPG